MASMDFAQLGIEIDTRQLKTGEKALSSFSSAASSTEKAIGSATKVMAAFIGAATLGELVKMADTMTQLSARINLYTKSQAESNAVMAQLNTIANQAGASIGDVAGLYSRMAQSLQAMGATQGQILQLTQTINNLAKVSGASPEAVSNAMMQLSQSLAGGIVRAEEFNSIVENTPLIAQEAAKAMGLTMGQLRNQMLAGKLSAQDFANAILASSDNAAAMAATMPRTVGQATTALTNNFMQFINAVNTSTESTATLSAAIDLIAGGFEELTAFVASGELGAYADSFAVQWQTAGQDIINMVDSVVNVFESGLQLIGTNGGEVAQFLIDAFWNFPSNVKAVIQIAVVELAAFVDRAKVYGEEIAFYLNPENWFSDANMDQYVNDAIAKINKARDATVDSYLKQRDAGVAAGKSMRDEADSVRKKYEETAAANKITLNSDPIIGGLPQHTAATAKTKKNIESLKNSYADFAKEISRYNASSSQQITNWQTDQLAELEKYHAAGVVGEQQYAANRIAIQNEANRRMQELTDSQWDQYLDTQTKKLLELRQKAQTQLSGAQRTQVVSGIDQQLNQQTFSGLPTISAGGMNNTQNEMDQLTQQTNAMNEAYNQRIQQYQMYAQTDIANKQYYYSQIKALEDKRTSENAAAQAAMVNLQLQAGESMATSAADSLKTILGEQSVAYRTMFAVQKAFSIAQSIIAIQTGIAQAAANPWPANLAAMASVAAATANIVSSIAAVAMPSFEGGGFTGSGSRTGGVDGKGGFYSVLHPNETVIDHTKSGSSSGSGTTVNITLQETSDTSKQGTVTQSTSQDGSTMVTAFVADLRSDSTMSKMIQSTFGLSRQGA